MTRPKSKRQDFGALLERVFHIKLSLPKSMLFDTCGQYIHRSLSPTCIYCPAGAICTEK